MGTLKDKFTKSWEDNCPDYRYNEDTDELFRLINTPYYVKCEDRLSRIGGFLWSIHTDVQYNG